MKKLVVRLVLIFFLFSGYSYANNFPLTHNAEEPGMEHIVLFRLRPNITDSERDEVVRRFVVLKDSEINGEPYILDLKRGVQNSKEGASGCYELGFIVSFKNEADRDYYVGRPFVGDAEPYDINHDEFKKFVAPYLADDSDTPCSEKNDGVLVFDFSNGI